MVEDDEAYVLGRILAGSAQLWIGERCAMVTEVTQVEGEPRKIHCWLAGGDMADILAITPGVEAWARMMGCKEATIEGRKGWSRVLAPMGYRGETVLRKAL